MNVGYEIRRLAHAVKVHALCLPGESRTSSRISLHRVRALTQLSVALNKHTMDHRIGFRSTYVHGLSHIFIS